MQKLVDGVIVELTDDDVTAWTAHQAANTPTLADIQTWATSLANSAAGQARTQFLTEVPGQDVTYYIKGLEAATYKSGQAAGTYPYLEAEASQTGQTLDVVAASVSATATEWNALSPVIEGIRRGLVVSIAAATTIDAIYAIVAADTTASSLATTIAQKAVAIVATASTTTTA
ncbi:hypothetical protein [Telmatospirillum sp.]|uniref:hypothetical protein n=1 Tax=Telmatospirillum sp. TaxID=2079197 RepID=UPI00284B70E5|nr:hypothetical protein [Telmatospirillum sp.]MDR3436452.1 hypothetical protein [Telmatospirillum sp.]